MESATEEKNMATCNETAPICEVHEQSRRRLLIASIQAMWLAISASLGGTVFCYLLLPPKVRRPDIWSDLGDISGLPEGEPVEMTGRRNRTDGWRLASEKTTAWVVKTQREIVAFAPECTHLGCAYHWDPAKDRFVCPCHASSFSIDGRVTDGPAPRPLDRYDVKLEGNRLLLGSLLRKPEELS
jgi:menaquinol-cytochrome c reductase iron-sulfur subunit